VNQEITVSKEKISKTLEDMYDKGFKDCEAAAKLAIEHGIKHAILAEREACAKLCDLFARSSANVPSRYEFMGESAQECANLIRERGNREST